jgi:hypothetical protein
MTSWRSLPFEWKSAGPDRGAFAADGIRFEATPDGVIVRLGHLGRQLLRAYQAGVAAAAGVGLQVIVDEVVIDKTSWDDWGVALAGLDVVWVGIRCSAEVAEERSHVRGDRFAGLARAQAATVHHTPDTTSRSTRRPKRLPRRFWNSRADSESDAADLQVLVRCVCGLQVSARGFPDGVQIRFGVITIGLEKSSPNRSGVSNMAPIRSAYFAM